MDKYLKEAMTLLDTKYRSEMGEVEKLVADYLVSINAASWVEVTTGDGFFRDKATEQCFSIGGN